MRKKSRTRQINLARLCYKNAKRFLRDARLLKKDRSYGHAFALSVLGIEQLGMAIYWWWTSIGLMKHFPKEFADGLHKRRTIQRSHEKKQFITLFILILILAISIFWIVMKESDDRVGMKKVTRTSKLNYNRVMKKMSKVLKNLNERKFKGLYVDGYSRINTGPFQFRAKEVNEIIGLLDMMVSVLKLDNKRLYSISIHEDDLKLLNKGTDVAKTLIEEDVSKKDYKKRIKKELENEFKKDEVLPL